MSCLIEPAVSALVDPIVSFLWDPLVRQFDYLFKVGSNMRNLKKVSNKLRQTKDMVEEKINDPDIPSPEEVEPSKQVSEWMDQVRTIEEQVTKINNDYNDRKICLCGCPINCWSSYRIGKRAAKTSLKVNELISEVKEFDSVIRRRVLLAPKLITIPISTPSTVEYLSEVSKYMMVDDVDIIGIWGMGGVGKTTLLKEINNHSSVENEGFYVIWVVASKEADLHRLQSDIAKRVHLRLDETASLDSRARSLCESLKTKKCILLIDDIWESLDVKMLGVSYPKHKVVFTTRSMEVCNDMIGNKQEIKLRCRKIKIDCLKREEGWQLFLQSVGEEVKTVIESDRRVRSYAEKVADKCGGLPLALVVIAKTMTAKTTWREWKDVADSIKKMDWSKTVIPFPVLKVSYDRLPSDSEKNCFLHFALWPEDYEIEENELIFCWLGMNLIDKCDDIGSAYNKGHSIIQYLKRVCLLEEGKGASHGGVCTVKMHDIIREMALWILSSHEESNKNFLVLNEAQLKRVSECSTKWREAKAISLFKGRLDALPEHVPDCPNLSITIIQETNFLRGIPRSFFQNMLALTYLDLSSNRFSEFPQAICSLLQLQFLNLSENISNIGFSLPSELSNLKELRYIFLRHTAVRSIPHKLILSMKKLEILDMFHANYYRWGKDDEASIHEVLECSSARVLGIDIRAINTLERLSDNAHISIWWLNVYDLYRVTTLSLSESLFRTSNMRGTLRALTIEDCENLEEIDANSIYDEGCESLEHLKLYKLNNLRKLSLARKLLLENVRNLVIDGCKKLKNVTWVMKLRHLETLEVSYCDSMEQVIGDREDGDEGNDDDGLSNLKRLQLCHLPLLSCFKTRTDVLPTSLKFVDIFGCPKLDKTPFAHISNDR